MYLQHHVFANFEVITDMIALSMKDPVNVRIAISAPQAANVHRLAVVRQVRAARAHPTIRRTRSGCDTGNQKQKVELRAVEF